MVWAGMLKALLGIRGENPAALCALYLSMGMPCNPLTFANPEGRLLNATGWKQLLDKAAESCQIGTWERCDSLLDSSSPLLNATWSEMNGNPSDIRTPIVPQGPDNAAFEVAYLGYIFAGSPTAYGWRHLEFSALRSCRPGISEAHCMRGVCVPSDSASTEQGTSTFSPGAQSPQSPPFCYRDQACSAGLECNLPPPLHGHAALHLKLSGQKSVHLVFGGESTDFLRCSLSRTRAHAACSVSLSVSVCLRACLSLGRCVAVPVCVCRCHSFVSVYGFRVDITMADAWEVGLVQRGRAANIGAPLVRYLYHLLHFVYGDVDPASHFL